MDFLKRSVSPNHIRKSLPVLVLLAALLVAFLLIMSSNNRENKPSSEKAWIVSAISIERGTYTPNIILNGVTESPHQSSLEAAVNADVRKTHVYEGDLVEKDQLLIELDDREAKLLVAQRTADVADLDAQIRIELNRVATDKKLIKHEEEILTLNRRDLERQQTLKNKSVGSQSAIDEQARAVQQQELLVANRRLAIEDHENRLNQIKARLQRAKALLDQAQLDLSRTTIRAPFNGRITKLEASPGERVQVGETLIEIYDSSKAEVRAQVPSQYVPLLSDALQKKLTLTATAMLDGKELQLTLLRLAGEAAMGVGGVDALLRIENKPDYSALGRSLEVYLNLPPVNDAIKLPPLALYGNDRIYVIKDDRMQAVSVQRIGLLQDREKPAEILIKSDTLKAGDKVITTQLPNARTGLLVTLSQPNAKP